MTNEELELSQSTNWEQEENLEEIDTDDLDNISTEEEQEEYEEEQETETVNKRNAPKLLAERKKLKNENYTLKQRLSELEFKAEIAELKAEYWEINVDELKEFMTESNYNSLPLKDVMILYQAKKPKEDKPSNMWMVWTKWIPATKYITAEKLSQLNQVQYNNARQLIDEWKLFIK